MSRGKEWWDNWFLELAQYISTASKDPSTKVGAVIVDHKRRIVSLGYNGFPRGLDDNPQHYTDRDLKLERVVHAEANAILNATADLENCTLYCTFFPCPHCAALIIQKGITRVVARANPSDERYKERQEIAKDMFFEADIDF